MLIATKFEILRGITSSGRLAVDLAAKPKRVVTLLDEPLFLSSGHQITHHKTVFFEEQFHDWRWSDGKLYYYSRVAQVADVLVVYEDMEVRFCTVCGAQLEKPGAECENIHPLAC